MAVGAALASTAAGQEVTLSWADNSDNEIGFVVERSITGLLFLPIGTTDKSVTFFADRNVSYGSTYYYRVRAFNDFGFSGYTDATKVTVTDKASSPPPPPPPPPPTSTTSTPTAGVVSTLIGSMSVEGKSEYDAELNLHMMTASGRGYESVDDELRFTHVEADGDFSLTVKIHDFHGDGTWARAGLMARQSLEQDSRHASIVINGRGDFETLIRSVDGDAVVTKARASAGAATFLRIERRSGTVQLSYSKDGATWSSGSDSSLSMSGRILLGIALGSESDGKLSGTVVEVVASDLPGFSVDAQASAQILGRPVESVLIGQMDRAGTYDYSETEDLHRLSASGLGYESLLDELRFSKVSFSGDVSLTVRISDYVPDATWSRAGLMIRQSEARDSAHLSMLVNGRGDFETICRPTKGAGLVTRQSGSAGSVAYLRIEKSGATVRGLFSNDGKSWTKLYEMSGLVEGTYDIGLAIGSQSDGAMSSASFQVQDGALPPQNTSPKLLGRAVQSSVIGSMEAEGRHFFDEASQLHFLSASGAGYESVNDELRYLWVKVSGDFTLSAFVTDYRPDGDWSRIGLMVRQSLAQDSKQASVAINGRGDYEMLYRKANGQTLASSRTGNSGGEGYIRLKKAGDGLSFYRSSNGVDWNKIGSVSIVFGTEFYVGLAIGSETDGALSSGIFEVLE